RKTAAMGARCSLQVNSRARCHRRTDRMRLAKLKDVMRITSSSNKQSKRTVMNTARRCLFVLSVLGYGLVAGAQPYHPTKSLTKGDWQILADEIGRIAPYAEGQRIESDSRT